MGAGSDLGSRESGSMATVPILRSPITHALSPLRLGQETGEAAGTLMEGHGSRRPAVRAFERQEPSTPVKVPPLPRPKRQVPRWRCQACDRTDDEPYTLCDPVPVS